MSSLEPTLSSSTLHSTGLVHIIGEIRKGGSGARFMKIFLKKFLNINSEKFLRMFLSAVLGKKKNKVSTLKCFLMNSFFLKKKITGFGVD